MARSYKPRLVSTDTALRIEKNVPLPARGVLTVYPLDEMEVGDSFFVYTRNIPTIRTAIHAQIKRQASLIKITTRREPGGMRIWRIE